jgi:hypothetical protein
VIVEVPDKTKINRRGEIIPFWGMPKDAEWGDSSFECVQIIWIAIGNRVIFKKSKDIGKQMGKYCLPNPV